MFGGSLFGNTVAGSISNVGKILVVVAGVGGATASGEADAKFARVYEGQGGAVAAGAAQVSFARVYQGTGNALASGSATTAFGRVYQGSGTSVAGGSAAAAFGRVYSATGGAVASGHAPFGKVYNFKWEHGGPDFKLGDLLLARRLDYDKAASKVTLMEVRGVVQTIDAEGEANVEIISGSAYLPFFGVGIEFVRIGNKIDPNRRGSVYLTSDDVAAPFIDVIDGVDDFSKLGALSTIKARLGRLSGITDTNFGALTGYGLYTENAYLKGTIAGGAASAFMTGVGYHFDKLGNARFGNPTNGRYINFDVATGLVNIGSGVALQWASVTGTGKPADNATVGADWGTNVTGRPTNLVALGDIPGYIQSTYINSTEIKAPNITGNSILGGNIVASSGGTNTAGLTGEGSGDTAVRIWAGSTYANRASAPFRVSQGGAVYADNITISGEFNAGAAWVADTGLQIREKINFYDIGLSTRYVQIVGKRDPTLGFIYLEFNASDTINGKFLFNSSVYINGNGVWHAGNDGTNSGLDADLLDGLQASAFAPSVGANYTNWDIAYTDRLKWDGGATGLNATTGRASLGLGSMAVKNTGLTYSSSFYNRIANADITLTFTDGILTSAA